MKTRQVLLLSTFVFSLLSVEAQYNETIRSGRPGQSIGPYTVGKNVIQIQAGHLVQWNNFDLAPETDGLYTRNTNEEVVVRYGFLEHVEAHFRLGYTDQRSIIGNTTFNNQFGFDNLGIAGRVNILRNPNGLLPALGVQTQLLLPLESGQDLGGRITVITSRTLDSKFSLASNYIYTGFGNGRRSFNYVYTLSYQLSKRIGLIAEHYGGFTQNQTFAGGQFIDEVTWQKNFDMGIALLLTKNLQLDVFGNFLPTTTFGVNGYSSFINAGVSWRTKMKEKVKVEE